MKMIDDVDYRILKDRQENRFNLKGPLTGDFIRSSCGLLSRITHSWGDSFQTCHFSENGEEGSFYLFKSGKLDYSGGLLSSIPVEYLKETKELLYGNAWFFHHDKMEAFNGVNIKVLVRVYELREDFCIANRIKK